MDQIALFIFYVLGYPLTRGLRLGIGSILCSSNVGVERVWDSKNWRSSRDDLSSSLCEVYLDFYIHRLFMFSELIMR